MLIKRIDNGKLPFRQTSGAAGYDCYARVSTTIAAGKTAVVPLGFAVMLPYHTEMQIRGRSGLSKRGILCATGCVDEDYRGEVCCILTNTTDQTYTVDANDRICQAIIIPVLHPEMELVDELPTTQRGTNGFGSTGVS
jgi:dUTP pyrophosphatase